MTAALREALGRIVEHYDARSELYTSDAECAGGMADIARTALSAQVPEDELIERCATALLETWSKETGPNRRASAYEQGLAKIYARAVLEAADRIEVLSSGQGRMGE